MQYRPYGRMGFDVSTFGMGLMRLPETNDGKIDFEAAYSMVSYAVDNGVNYFDTAYVYHNDESEGFLGKAMQQGGFRKKIKIATKMPVWNVRNLDDAKRFFETELQRLQTDYIDCYLMHALDEDSWKKAKEINLPKYFKQLKDEGAIGAVCFSFHDDFDTFKAIVNENEWDMAQIQMNYLDVNNQATLEGMRFAHKKGLAVVIMEPLRGGNLANVPADVKAAFDEYPEKRSPVEWGFRFLYDFPEVSTILSGVSTMEQLQENISIFNRALAEKMTDEEKSLYDRAIEIFETRSKVPCTGCSYCVPCPAGVAIPDVFAHINYAGIMDDIETGKRRYARLIKSGNDASKCIECGACEALCPQHIEIIEALKRTDSLLRA